MYNEFYGLSENAFSLTSDPKYFFKTQDNEEVLKYLDYLLDNRQGFLEITGPIGSGKTILCKTWLQQLPPNVISVFFNRPNISELDFLEEVTSKLGIENKGSTYSEFIRYLNDYLLTAYAEGKKVVFIFDDAHKLSLDLLETIRLCSNLETEKEKLLQIVLVGSSELDINLRQQHLRQLDQRISLRFQLKPLKKSQIKAYIDQHLEIAGKTTKLVFTRSAIRLIYKFSHGTPRLINQICDKALLMGYFFKSNKITRKLVEAAIKNTQERWQQHPSLFFLSLSRTAVWTILLLLTITMALSLRFQENIITWTEKISPTISLIKVSLLHRLHMPPVPPEKGEKPSPKEKSANLKTPGEQSSKPEAIERKPLALNDD